MRQTFKNNINVLRETRSPIEPRQSTNNFIQRKISAMNNFQETWNNVHCKVVSLLLSTICENTHALYPKPYRNKNFEEHEKEKIVDYSNVNSI